MPWLASVTAEMQHCNSNSASVAEQQRDEQQIAIATSQMHQQSCAAPREHRAKNPQGGRTVKTSSELSHLAKPNLVR